MNIYQPSQTSSQESSEWSKKNLKGSKVFRKSLKCNDFNFRKTQASETQKTNQNPLSTNLETDESKNSKEKPSRRELGPRSRAKSVLHLNPSSSREIRKNLGLLKSGAQLNQKSKKKRKGIISQLTLHSNNDKTRSGNYRPYIKNTINLTNVAGSSYVKTNYNGNDEANIYNLNKTQNNEKIEEKDAFHLYKKQNNSIQKKVCTKEKVKSVAYFKNLTNNKSLYKKKNSEVNLLI